MKYAIAAIAGCAVGVIATAIAITPTVEYRTQVIERTVIDEEVRMVDLEELREQIAGLDADLYEECVHVIARHTDDPIQGIRNHVDRHYDGDACRAAAEAQRGEW